MLRPSDRRGRLALGVLTLVALAGVQAAPSGDDALLEAQQMAEQGHIAQAEVLLHAGARQGELQAMERLAMLHWYGPVLYPGGPWKPELAYQWFERAAAQGSELSRHMLGVVQRARLAQR